MRAVYNQNKGNYTNAFSIAEQYFATKTFKAYDAYKLIDFIYIGISN